MTIDEAIKHLHNLYHYWDCFANKEEANALELGIEALEQVGAYRHFPDRGLGELLLGETREGAK